MHLISGVTYRPWCEGVRGLPMVLPFSGCIDRERSASPVLCAGSFATAGVLWVHGSRRQYMTHKGAAYESVL
jgi:hypothetical protein